MRVPGWPWTNRYPSASQASWWWEYGQRGGNDVTPSALWGKRGVKIWRKKLKNDFLMKKMHQKTVKRMQYFHRQNCYQSTMAETNPAIVQRINAGRSWEAFMSGLCCDASNYRPTQVTPTTGELQKEAHRAQQEFLMVRAGDPDEMLQRKAITSHGN